MSGFVRLTPEGDNRERMVCTECGHIAHEIPKIVAGAIVVANSAVLLCRRGIEPRLGYWTLPAGHLELGETLEEGARRETWEEAQARIGLDGILGVFSKCSATRPLGAPATNPPEDPRGEQRPRSQPAMPQ